MGINDRYNVRESKNAPQRPMEEGIYFEPYSPYYHQEEWKEITDWMVPGIRQGAYYISNHGKIYSNIKSTIKPNGGILSPAINQKGYYQISLQSEYGKKGLCCKIHRLVLLAFGYIPGCQSLEVDHIDQNKNNNCLWNLQWVTPRENTQNAIQRGYKEVSLESTGGRFLTDEEAQSLFNELVKANNDFEIDCISRKYNVTSQYSKGMLNGSIRPYYKKQHDNNIIKNKCSK